MSKRFASYFIQDQNKIMCIKYTIPINVTILKLISVYSWTSILDNKSYDFGIFLLFIFSSFSLSCITKCNFSPHSPTSLPSVATFLSFHFSKSSLWVVFFIISKTLVKKSPCCFILPMWTYWFMWSCLFIFPCKS